MPSGLKRWHDFGHDHFVTFTCYHQHRFLNDDPSRQTFEEQLETIRARHGFFVFGYCLMPNHVHLLMSEPKHGKLADTFRALKTQTSKKLKGDRKHFWQRRYFDRNIFTRDEFVEKLQYIHRNPVVEGMVACPEDWPWSSYRHWQTGEQGRVEIESHWPGEPESEPRHISQAFLKNQEAGCEAGRENAMSG